MKHSTPWKSSRLIQKYIPQFWMLKNSQTLKNARLGANLYMHMFFNSMVDLDFQGLAQLTPDLSKSHKTIAAPGNYDFKSDG